MLFCHSTHSSSLNVMLLYIWSPLEVVFTFSLSILWSKYNFWLKLLGQDYHWNLAKRKIEPLDFSPLWRDHTCDLLVAMQQQPKAEFNWRLARRGGKRTRNRGRERAKISIDHLFFLLWLKWLCSLKLQLNFLSMSNIIKHFPYIHCQSSYLYLYII